MIRPDLSRTLGPWLAASVLALPLALSAQTTESVQSPDWRTANAVVGTFQRGHADILKWERAHSSAQPTAPEPLGGLAVPTPADAVRLAWRVHPSLARVQSRLGSPHAETVLSGRWLALDPSLQRRVGDMDELLAVAVQARKAWVQAVAARQMVVHQQTALEAAQAANALGQRMVAVGNWSRLQQSPVQLAEASARMQLRRAQLAAAQAQASLIDVLGLAGQEDTLNLPDRLPDVPAQPWSEAELAQATTAIQGQLPTAEQRRHPALARLAIQTYQAAHAQALDARDVVLKERAYITEETVLHYNGMLKSVWDLLDASRQQAQATADALGAQRDFWLADTDLQWVMQGGQPDGFVTLGGGAAESPSAAPH